MKAFVTYKTYKIICENGIYRLYNNGLECFCSSDWRAAVGALHAVFFNTNALKAAT